MFPDTFYKIVFLARVEQDDAFHALFKFCSKQRVSTEFSFLLTDFNTRYSKKLVWGFFQILFGKRCFQRGVRKTWRISLSGQVSRKTSGLNQILALSYGSKQNVVKMFGFALLGDSFCKRFLSY